MAQRDDLDSKLPGARDDEPASLRQDIIDELSDHLQCSLEQELVNENDVDQARKKALNRFGVPSSIVRQLWFESMRESIMLQRVLVGACVVMMCICLVVAWIAWSAVETSRQANRQLLMQLAAAKQHQTTTSSRITKLVPSTLRLVDPDDQPVPLGYSISLTAPAHLNNNMLIDFERKVFQVGDDGVVNLGSLPRNVFFSQVKSPWNEWTNVVVDPRPETVFDKTVLCPDGPPKTASLTIDIDWPEDLRKRKFGVCFRFRHDFDDLPVRNGNRWTFGDSMLFSVVQTSDGQYALLSGNDGYVEEDGTFYLQKEDIAISLNTTARIWVGKYRLICMSVLPQTSTINGVEGWPAKSLAWIVFHGRRNTVAQGNTSSSERLDMLLRFPKLAIEEGEDNVMKISPPTQLIELLRGLAAK